MVKALPVQNLTPTTMLSWFWMLILKMSCLLLLLSMLLLLMLLLFKVNIRLDPRRGEAGVTAILFAARQKLLAGKASSNCLRYPLSTVLKDGIIWRKKQ